MHIYVSGVRMSQNQHNFNEWIAQKRIEDVFEQIQHHRDINFNAVVSMGQAAIKASMIVHAGALVSSMAF